MLRDFATWPTGRILSGKSALSRDQHPVEGATYRRLRAVILHVVGPERGTSRGEPNAEYLRVRQGLTDELASL
jgi:hypothetical protein